MAGKVLVNLTTGMEDPEQVTLAFLVAGAALEQGKGWSACSSSFTTETGSSGSARSA